MKPTTTIAMVAAAVALGTAACVPTPETAAAKQSTGDSSTVARQLAALRVAPADTGAHYNRDDWPHWDSVGKGCNRREDTLKVQGRNVKTGKGCKVLSGEWTSRYDGITVTDPEAVDVDHMVPLAEAARSGTRGWSEKQRTRYANDPNVLVAVTAKSNRAKGDQDPAKWLPAKDRCGYVAHWVWVKTTYAMTVDQAEHDAIAAILRHC
ncbi:HNH endonuclease family protein [Amycolatopsis sp. NPDC102389]|uniref:HNH endonuclease family protein n=1 Tax=Amycolatopsis sp. NPDC102389 TaxID=3363941 RepID=UPI0037F47FBB